MVRDSGLRTSAAKVRAPRDSRAKVENLTNAISGGDVVSWR